jgi:hypothetical protein
MDALVGTGHTAVGATAVTMALDDTYENLQFAWRSARVYDWTWRVWRTVLLSPWRIGHSPQPADPDAVLDEAAPYFVAKNKGGRKTDTKERIIAALHERSPQTCMQLSSRLCIPYETVRGCIGNNGSVFEQAGRDRRRRVLYRVRVTP